MGMVREKQDWKKGSRHRGLWRSRGKTRRVTVMKKRK